MTSRTREPYETEILSGKTLNNTHVGNWFFDKEYFIIKVESRKKAFGNCIKRGVGEEGETFKDIRVSITLNFCWIFSLRKENVC